MGKGVPERRRCLHRGSLCARTWSRRPREQAPWAFRDAPTRALVPNRSALYNAKQLAARLSLRSDCTQGRVGFMPTTQLDILALEPFYGGARRVMLESLIKCSRHRWTLLKLPPRRIERRLIAAAHWFAEQLS